MPASTPRWSSNLDESFRADKSVAADDSAPAIGPIKLPRLNVAHVRPIAALSTFALASADPMPASSTFDWTTAETPVATLRRAMIAARAPAERFLKALHVASPVPADSLPPTRLAFAALPDATFNAKLSTAREPERARTDYSFLAYYTYSEAPPPEKPADTLLRAFKDIPEGTPLEEVQRAARAFGLDVTFMEAVVKIESDFDPKQRTGSYIGLYQLSNYEFDRYGSGDITNARDNAIAGAYKFAVAAIMFELATHKKATPAYLYLIHQQGTQGAAEHVAHPDRIAWESMCATDEGRVKGEKWCKRAIWQNTLPEVKKAWGSVEKLTSAAFVTMWSDRVATLYQRYSASASASAAH